MFAASGFGCGPVVGGMSWHRKKERRAYNSERGLSRKIDPGTGIIATRSGWVVASSGATSKALRIFYRLVHAACFRGCPACIGIRCTRKTWHVDGSPTRRPRLLYYNSAPIFGISAVFATWGVPQEIDKTHARARLHASKPVPRNLTKHVFFVTFSLCTYIRTRDETPREASMTCSADALNLSSRFGRGVVQIRVFYVPLSVTFHLRAIQESYTMACAPRDHDVKWHTPSVLHTVLPPLTCKPNVAPETCTLALGVPLHQHYGDAHSLCPLQDVYQAVLHYQKATA